MSRQTQLISHESSLHLHPAPQLSLYINIPTNKSEKREKEIKTQISICSMATSRLMRASNTSRPAGLGTPTSSSSILKTSSRNVMLRCVNKLPAGFSGEKRLITGEAGLGERKPAALVAKAAAAMSMGAVAEATQRLDHLGYLLAAIKVAVFRGLKVAAKPRPWKLLIQMFIEKGIIDCRFFTIFAVAGSLLGSVLCFVEGCLLVMESYLYYFHALSHKSDQGHIMQLLIESIDMFLVGTAMLMFGMGLHVMFVGSQNLKANGSQLPTSNLFGLFHLKKLPSWVGMKSITQAKSRIGHALMMILQVGVLDKFKSIPLVTGLDLACFAGAVFISSAAIFLLSRLAVRPTTITEKISN